MALHSVESIANIVLQNTSLTINILLFDHSAELCLQMVKHENAQNVVGLKVAEENAFYSSD